MREDQENMHLPFEERNAEILEQYRALVFDPDAKCDMYILPCMAICFHDEAPGGTPDKKASPSMWRFFMVILQARANLWKGEVLEPPLQEAWDRMRKLVPNWPGFRRVEITQKEREWFIAMEEAERRGFERALNDDWDGPDEDRPS